VESSESIERRIRQKIDHLSRFSQDIIGCRVTVDAPHRHQHKGNVYAIRIDIHVRDGEIVVNREPGVDQTHTDLYAAIRDAFASAARQLEDYVRRRRGFVKRHSQPSNGTPFKDV
jgi:ribosomal subunit interface protein